MKFTVVRCAGCGGYHTLSELIPHNGNPDSLGCPKGKLGSASVIMFLDAVGLQNLREEIMTMEDIEEMKRKKQDWTPGNVICSHAPGIHKNY